jgi:hypothetical protein
VDQGRFKEVIRTLAEQSEALQLFKRDPEAFAKRFDLDVEALRGLKAADLLLIKGRHKAGGTATYTFATATTTTVGGTSTMTFETGTTVTAGQSSS